MSPQGNGTGPLGQGPGTERGLGQGRGRGRQPGGFGLGPDGNCVCTNPDCGHKIVHKRGTPYYKEKCPKCGSPMVRERPTSPEKQNSSA